MSSNAQSSCQITCIVLLPHHYSTLVVLSYGQLPCRPIRTVQSTIFSCGSLLPTGSFWTSKRLFSVNKIDEGTVPSPFQSQSIWILLGFVPLSPTRRYSTFPLLEVLVFLSRIVSCCNSSRYSGEKYSIEGI
jgi:hypothetical protein